MWIRTRPDIGKRDLLKAFLRSFFAGNRNSLESKIAECWSCDEDVLITLSVRSAFDLLLRALDLPAGSEVLFSAITVPGMIEIAEKHALTVVPVDLDADGRASVESLRLKISPRSRVLVIAHLFGDHAPLQNLASIARDHGLLLVEDCAQGFQGRGFQAEENRVESGSNADAVDVSLYSFGPIKTATALGGGLAMVKDTVLAQRMRSLLGSDPVQLELAYRKRLLRYFWIRLLANRIGTAILFFSLKRLGRDPDDVLLKWGKGFSGHDLLAQIRRRPCKGLLALILSRVTQLIDHEINARKIRGRLLDRRLGIERPSEHTYWAYCVFVHERDQAISELRSMGLDATYRTRMTLVRPSLAAVAQGKNQASETPMAEWIWNHMCFLPVGPPVEQWRAIRAIDALIERLAKPPVSPHLTTKKPDAINPVLQGSAIREDRFSVRPSHDQADREVHAP